MKEIDDKLIGENVTFLRGNMSMDMLAAKMRDRGQKWTKTTVFNIEHGDRQLRLTESIDLLACLGYDNDEQWRLFVAPSERIITERITKTRKMADEVEDICDRLLLKRIQLAELAAGSDISKDKHEEVAKLLTETSLNSIFTWMKASDSNHLRNAGIDPELFKSDDEWTNDDEGPYGDFLKYLNPNYRDGSESQPDAD